MCPLGSHNVLRALQQPHKDLNELRAACSQIRQLQDKTLRCGHMTYLQLASVEFKLDDVIDAECCHDAGTEANAMRFQQAVELSRGEGRALPNQADTRSSCPCCSATPDLPLPQAVTTQTDICLVTRYTSLTSAFIKCQFIIHWKSKNPLSRSLEIERPSQKRVVVMLPPRAFCRNYGATKPRVSCCHRRSRAPNVE